MTDQDAARAPDSHPVLDLGLCPAEYEEGSQRGGAGDRHCAVEERQARAVLTSAVEPGDWAVGRLLQRFGAVEALARVRAGRLPGTERRAQLYQRRLDGPPGEELLESAAARGIAFLCPGDAGWPLQLEPLGLRLPVGLWVRGAALRPVAARSVAVVGTRQATPYGGQVAAELGCGLAERCWCVVSGGAFGIDAAAHRGALAAGPTIAVLANGVDVAYPKAHAALLERIAGAGTLVAELPPGTRPNRYRFLERNRLIAALSRGTVVVEAPERSGALRTAHEALALGRSVMAVPGHVTSPWSAGTHGLLRDGAVLVATANDVIEQVAWNGEQPRQQPPGRPMSPTGPPEGGGTDRSGGTEDVPGTRAEGVAPGPAADVVAGDGVLGEDLRRILHAVRPRGDTTPEEVAAAVAVPAGVVLAALAALEASGWVARTAVGWRRC